MSECIPWHGPLSSEGYGYFARKAPGKGNRYAHRHVWEECFGPIPDRMHVHHECAQRTCINPEHLRLMSPSDHTRLHDMMPVMRAAFVAKCRAQTHCKRGHELTPENTYRYAVTGWRQCRACCAEGARRRCRERAALRNQS